MYKQHLRSNSIIIIIIRLLEEAEEKTIERPEERPKNNKSGGRQNGSTKKNRKKRTAESESESKVTVYTRSDDWIFSKKERKIVKSFEYLGRSIEGTNFSDNVEAERKKDTAFFIIFLSPRLFGLSLLMMLVFFSIKNGIDLLKYVN